MEIGKKRSPETGVQNLEVAGPMLSFAALRGASAFARAASMRKHLIRAFDFFAVERGGPELNYAGLVREHAAPESGVQTRHDWLHARSGLCGFDVPVYYGELQRSECSAGCALSCAPARPTFFVPGSRELLVFGVWSVG